MAIFFALIAFIGWGVADVFGTIAARRIGSVNTFFWMMVFSSIIISFYIPFAGPIKDIGIFILAIILGIFNLYAAMLYFKALEIGNASLVGSIAGSFGFISAVLSIFIFGEHINTLQIVGIFCAAIGIMLSSLKLEEIRNNNMKGILSEPSIKYALIALMIWGVSYALVRIPVGKIGWFWTQLPFHLLFPLLIIAGKIKKDATQIFRDKKSLLSVFLFTITGTVGVFSYNLGITFGYTSIVAPIAGSSAVIFVILTRLVFKEPLTRQQKIGIVSSLVGIVLISFAS